MSETAQTPSQIPNPEEVNVHQRWLETRELTNAADGPGRTYREGLSRYDGRNYPDGTGFAENILTDERGSKVSKGKYWSNTGDSSATKAETTLPAGGGNIDTVSAVFNAEAHRGNSSVPLQTHSEIVRRDKDGNVVETIRTNNQLFAEAVGHAALDSIKAEALSRIEADTQASSAAHSHQKA